MLQIRRSHIVAAVSPRRKVRMIGAPDPSVVIAVMRETADEVIMPRFQSLKSGDVEQKTGPEDLVTIADIESEHRLTPILKDMLPGSQVIGEEAYAANPAILGTLTEDAPVWIVDPVDGTNNFAKGSAKFCIMVGLVHRRQPVLGVILDPLQERAAFAVRGEGAWMAGYSGKAERLATRLPATLDKMRGALNFRFLPSPLKEEMRQRAGRPAKSGRHGWQNTLGSR